MELFDINKCHFCDRIAEFSFENLPICNKCIVEKSGDEWDLYSIDGKHFLGQTFNRDNKPFDSLITSGTFDEMWKLSNEMNNRDNS